jgi:hypothetical protein
MTNEHEIEAKISELESAVSLRDSLHKLLKNPDFKALILDGYITDEAVRSTKLLGDPSVRGNERVFNSVVDELKAIGLFDNHLIAIQNIGNQADADLKAYRAGEANDTDFED